MFPLGNWSRLMYMLVAVEKFIASKEETGLADYNNEQNKGKIEVFLGTRKLSFGSGYLII